MALLARPPPPARNTRCENTCHPSARPVGWGCMSRGNEAATRNRGVGARLHGCRAGGRAPSPPPPVTAAAPPFWNQVGDFPGGLGAHSGENGLRPHATQRPATGQGGKSRVPSFPESRSPPTHRAALVGVTARCDCAPHRRGESGRCGLWWTPARWGHGPDGRGSPRRWERAWQPPRRGHLCSRGRPERPRLPPPSLTPS